MYEYMDRSFKSAGYIIRGLNELGKDGWMVVSYSVSSDDYHDFILMRKIGN